MISVQDKLVRFQESKDFELRQDLLEYYLPLVKVIAKGFVKGLPRPMEFGDLVGIGVIGLVKALESFDPTREVQFQTYASIRIQGSILDEFRKLDWAGRKARSRIKAIEKVVNGLRGPRSDAEVAGILKISEKEVFLLRGESATFPFWSLDVLVSKEDDDRETPRVETLEGCGLEDFWREIDLGDWKKLLSRAKDFLSDQERLVIELYYSQGLSMREIGESLGRSQAWVSLCHIEILQKLRKKFLSWGVIEGD